LSWSDPTQNGEEKARRVLGVFVFDKGVVSGLEHFWPMGAMKCKELTVPPKEK